MQCVGVHLAHGRDYRAVRLLVALDHVVGEEAAGAQLGYPERQRPHAGHQPPLAVAVPAVARRAAELVCLGAHDLVHHALGELAEQLPHVHEPVPEARDRQRRLRRRHVCYAVHCGHCLSLESDLSRSQILGNGRFPYKGAVPGLTPTFPTRSRMPASRLVKHETLSKSSKAVSHSKAKPSRQNQRTRDHIVATNPQVWTPHAEAACFEARKELSGFPPKRETALQEA